MARVTRAKFKCHSIELNGNRVPVMKQDPPESNKWVTVYDEDGKPMYQDVVQPKVHLSPVYAPDDTNHENHRFWQASPSGAMWLAINNPEGAEVFEVGKEYYVDFTLAD